MMIKVLITYAFLRAYTREDFVTLYQQIKTAGGWSIEKYKSLVSRLRAATRSRTQGHFFSMSNEIWKDIEGYEGAYQISNLGRVRSLDREQRNHSKMQVRKGGMLAIHYNQQRNNYASVMLCKDGKPTRHKLHRLVALHFIPLPEGVTAADMQVGHINGDPKDNRVENLRWCTAKENNGYELHRKILHETMKGRYAGEQAYWFGKHHSEESKQKMSAAHKGVSNPMKGKHYPLKTELI